MDRFDKMTINELHTEVKTALERQNELIGEVKEELHELKEQKSKIIFALMGSEMNDSNGLVKLVNDLRDKIDGMDKRVREVEDYQIGMKWGTRIVVGLISTGTLVGIVQGVKWIINNLNIK